MGNEDDGDLQRWEVCFVDLLNHCVTNLTMEGMRRTKIKRDKHRDDDSRADATARVVAGMGLEGWELTNGVGDVGPVLFFKRRVSGEE